ncbi:MAG: extracellular solute-binding protein family 5, partial [Nocardioidaceae bacterium]|nr:extracellular solute-binding protein family 5 [Nocardioidaceae bacterium]
MASYRKRTLAAVAATSMAALTLAACGGGGGSSSSGDTAKASAGGTLYYYIFKPIEHVDPQRIYVGRDISNFSRTVYRSLVAFPISTDPEKANVPTADLATDSGTSSNGAKTWTFTLKDGVKWQDGKAITCDDFKYGASRVFAQDVITGGPNYLLTYLDVPSTDDGPAYKGPYTKEGQAGFDKAITCDGNTITYNFKKAWPDFNLAVAALLMMTPYRADMDKGNNSNFQIFSNGPYKLDGEWSKEKGATFVRNDNYDPKTDSTDLRKALPDKIVFNIGNTTETIYDRLIADAGNDKFAVTSQSVPPAYYTQITGAVADRSVNVESPFVDYLVPNFKTPAMSNPVVRQALAMSLDDKSWISAGGGEKAFAPAKSIVNPAVVGYKDNPAFADIPESGDAAAAKKLLTDAGVTVPVPIKFTYPKSDTMDKQASALKEGWEKAGFSVTLDGLGDTYYDVIQKPSNDSDVIWGGWGSDWPSAITVTPPLFDSRPNLSKESTGQDYGNYKSDAFNALVDQAQSA